MERLEIVSKLIDNLESYKTYLQDRLGDEEFDTETIYDDLYDILTDVYYGN